MTTRQRWTLLATVTDAQGGVTVTATLLTLHLTPARG